MITKTRTNNVNHNRTRRYQLIQKDSFIICIKLLEDLSNNAQCSGFTAMCVSDALLIKYICGSELNSDPMLSVRSTCLRVFQIHVI
jgi:hypothetical protein